MLGAIIGDIVGSTREWHNIKTEDFELIPAGSRFTDDTVMTLAVAEWLMKDQEHRPETQVECMQALGRKYFNAGYGGMFRKWLMSDNPQPYGSFGNGSAMRVSPVGLYANSLEEALELARITASVTHNHPEGIKGAQAIAACVYMRRNQIFPEHEMKQYIEQHFGYDLSRNLEDIRPGYGFDVTCQGSVPIAIMAHLQQPHEAEKALRLAISMGGDSDTIGCMTAAIATTLQPHAISSSSLPRSIEEKCRQLLPADLLDINDRFEAFISRPLWQSYEVHGNGLFYAGEYPGDKNDVKAEQKIRQMVHFGIKHFVDLTEEGELRPYSHLLPKGCTYLRFPIQDVSAPKSLESVHQLLHRIDELKKQGGYVYLHCWGGVGRTGTIVACYLARVQDNPILESVLKALRNHFKAMPKSAHRITPESREQIDFIARFVESIQAYKEEKKKRIHDSIRGSLMAGTAGDALGFLPAAMLTHLIYKLIPLSVDEAKMRIVEIAEETITTLDEIYKGEFAEDKRILADLTRKTIQLAQSDTDDATAILQLGEGWTGEEAWAIALFCAIRHVDNMAEAIIASVNHDGDSDSTGSICGNIMGAIYGYEEIKRQRLFCPEGKKFEETLELHNIILTIADDLSTSRIISEYDPIDTPEKRQWYERYCEMKPVGI